MKYSHIALAVLTGAAYISFYPATLSSQRAEKLSMQTTTQERLDTEPWWPTKSTVDLQSFAGSDACASCHQDVVSQNTSAMRRAAVTGKDAKFLNGKPPLTFRSDSLMYYLKASPTGIDYSVAVGGRQLSNNLDWIMGAGNLARTFVYQRNGHWFQSQITLYSDQAALDTTTGLDKVSGSSLVTSLGQPLSVENARRCFGCHTVHATTSAGFDPIHAEAGLGCEACHGPGRAHIEQMNAASSNTGIRAEPVPTHNYTIFNPAALSPVDSIDFCGSCHRTFVDATVSLGQATSTAAVRFQPYRLQQSKCWHATQDARLRCVACHDPHMALNRNPASYNKYCVQCHSAAAVRTSAEHAKTVCPKAAGSCTTCHMPKVHVESMHGDFTDHRIRVVRAGESLPD